MWRPLPETGEGTSRADPTLRFDLAGRKLKLELAHG
jgi:hypothetical protein